MNKYNLSVIFAVLLILTIGCADDELKPIITFDDAGKGAYVALLQETARDINLFDISGSQYGYDVEFIDLEGGKLVAEYALDFTFVDRNPDNGDNSTGPTRFRSYSSGDFVQNSNGNQGITGITISASELISAAGISQDDLLAGDRFVIDGNVITVDGAVFTSSNSSAAVNGAAFRGHFRFTLIASCPTSLEGTYDYTLLKSWCDDVSINTGTVTLTLTGSGYDIDDFAFGAYFPCYGEAAALPLGNLRMVDVCNKISITGASQWGEVYTWHSLVVDGNDLTIEWSNDYGEGGTSTIHNPSGWPALELDN